MRLTCELPTNDVLGFEFDSPHEMHKALNSRYIGSKLPRRINLIWKLLVSDSVQVQSNDFFFEFKLHKSFLEM